MLATLTTKAFSDADWLFEIKWDGYRVQAVVDDGKVRAWTRSLKDAETYFPGLLRPPTWIDARQAIVDGEVVALDDAGRPDFSLLQERTGEKHAPNLVYQAFDLLYLDGRLLLDVALEDRKRLLKSVLEPHPRVRFTAHVEGEGETFHEAAKAQDLEGIVAKLKRSRYEPGRRSSAWLKIKIRPEQELVVGGWTTGRGQCPRSRCARGRRVRGRQAPLQRQGRCGVHRIQSPQACSRSSRHSPWTSRRSTRRRQRTIAAAGAAT